MKDSNKNEKDKTGSKTGKYFAVMVVASIVVLSIYVLIDYILHGY